MASQTRGSGGARVNDRWRDFQIVIKEKVLFRKEEEKKE